MAKKITFSQKPDKKLGNSIDDWVLADKRGTDKEFSENSLKESEKPKKEKEKLKKLTFTIPISLHEKLKIYSVKTGKTMKEFLEESIKNLPE